MIIYRKHNNTIIDTIGINKLVKYVVLHPVVILVGGAGGAVSPILIV